MITVEINQTPFPYDSTKWVDISDYIIDGSPVPFISRNRDYTLKIETVQLSLTIASGITPKLNDGIRVKSDGTLFWAGYISKAPLNYDNFSYDLEVTNNLYYLSLYKVDYPTLHPLFITGSNLQYLPKASVVPRNFIGDQGSSTLHLLFAMQQIFVVGGLTLDISSVDSISPFSYDFSAAKDGSLIHTVTYDDLYLWEEMLYCVNQPGAADHNALDYHYPAEFSKNKISLFDYISDICSSLSFGLYQTDVMAYKIIPTIPLASFNSYNPSNDTRYSDKYDPVHQQLPLNTSPGGGTTMNISPGGSIPRLIIGNDDGIMINNQLITGVDTVGFPFYVYCAIYQGTSIVSTPLVNNYVIPIGNGNGQDVSLPIYSNSGIYYNKFDGSGNKIYSQANYTPYMLVPSPDSTDNHGISHIPMLNVLKNKYNALYSDYVEETLTTDIDLTPFPVVQNYIDIKNQKSLIIQSPTGYILPQPSFM